MPFAMRRSGVRIPLAPPRVSCVTTRHDNAGKFADDAKVRALSIWSLPRRYGDLPFEGRLDAGPDHLDQVVESQVRQAGHLEKIPCDRHAQ